ncbi:MAG: hypothetical protein AABZ07_07055 [Nitrospirota bacterium]
MGMVMDTKKLSEDIVTSYDMRVKAISELVSNTHKMLKEFHADHNNMTIDLRRSLQKGENERIKNFKETMGNIKKFVMEMVEGTARLMGEIQKEQKDRKKGVAGFLDKFMKDHEFMANELRKSLAAGERGRVQDFKSMIGGIQQYVADVIKETERLIREIQSRQAERKEEILKLLQEFKVEREMMAANWQRLSETMYRKRGGKTPVRAAEEAKVTREIKPQVATMISKEAKPAVEAIRSKGQKRGGKEKYGLKKAFA